MRTLRACAALLVLTIASCTGSSGTGSSGSKAAASSPLPSTPVGCPATTAEVHALLGVTIASVQGATSGSTSQVCAFSTSATDLGALSVTYLRFPRAELKAKTLAQARDLYGSKLTGHTVVSMPAWGADAFLDETLLPDKDLVAEFAWVPHYEVILGMHSDDSHAAQRRELIDRLVAFTE